MYFSQRTQAVWGTGITILPKVYLSLSRRLFLLQFPELPCRLPMMLWQEAAVPHHHACIPGSANGPRFISIRLHTMLHEKKIIFYVVNLNKRRHRFMGFPPDYFANAEAREVYSPRFSTSYHLNLGGIGIDLLDKI